jgi:GGDEF domain-containing protein
MEIKLHQQRERILVDILDEAVVLIDQQGKVIHANPHACQSLGMTLEQLVNQQIHEHFVLDEQQQSNTHGICLKAINHGLLKRGFICGDHVRRVDLPNNDDSSHIALIWCLMTASIRTHDVSTGLPDRNMLVQQILPLLEQSHLSNPHSFVQIQLQGKDNKQLRAAKPEQLESLMTDIATLLSPHVRSRDLLSRSDMDCFVLLLRGCDLAHAEQITQKLLEEIQDYHDDYPDTDLPVWHICAGIIPLTNGKSIEDTFEKAKTACQQACTKASKTFVLNEGDWESE